MADTQKEIARLQELETALIRVLAILEIGKAKPKAKARIPIRALCVNRKVANADNRSAALSSW